MQLDIPVQERVAGLILGLAAGDKNGGPIRMALRLAGSLDRLQKFDAQDVGNCYLEWFTKEGFDTGPIAAAVAYFLFYFTCTFLHYSLYIFSYYPD